MTAPDPRVVEIQARLAAATPGPWVEWHENGTPWVEALAETLQASELCGDNYMLGRGSGFRIAGVRIEQKLRAAVAAANGDGRG